MPTRLFDSQGAQPMNDPLLQLSPAEKGTSFLQDEIRKLMAQYQPTAAAPQPTDAYFNQHFQNSPLGQGTLDILLRLFHASVMSGQGSGKTEQSDTDKMLKEVGAH